MKFILGKKKEMSQIFNESGDVVPVTIISAGPCTVSQIRTLEKDGYTAVKVGFIKKKGKKGETFRYQREFRIKDIKDFTAGQELTVGSFNPGEMVKVTGISKGKGFQGVVRRHHFHGAPGSHGTKDQLRMPGSIGATFPQHVFKGKRMPGRMGGQNVTVKNLEVIQINKEKNEMLVKGAVPGPRNGLVAIYTSGKIKKQKQEQVIEETEKAKKETKKGK